MVIKNAKNKDKITAVFKIVLFSYCWFCKPIQYKITDDKMIMPIKNQFI